MQIFNTTHKRKSAVITATILILLLIGIFSFGMKYLDPPIEYGVAINFGDSNVGSGEPVENTQAPPKNEEVEDVVEEDSEEVQEETPKEVVEENVVTEETTKQVPVVKKTDKPKEVKPKKETPKRKKKLLKTEAKPKKEKPKEKPKPKPSKATTDALNSLLSGNSSKGSTKGEGDDKQSGVKGSKDGDPTSSKYYGSGGKGSGGNYRLAGRKAMSKPKKQPDCEQEGTVVVAIYVNKSGSVTKATPGARGTTNSAPCLFKAAKEAALQTKWNSDANAPTTQKGTIIYKFSLSK